MQCVFTGLPRVGKSSFWKRLQGIIPDRLLPSTDITSSEGSVRLDVRGSCGFAVHVSELGWKKIQAEEEMDGFLSLITQQGSFPEHLQPQKPLEGRNLTLVQDSPGKKLGTETSDSNDVEIVKERSGLPISMDSSQIKVTFPEDGKEKHPKTDVALELQYKTTAKMEKTKDIQTVDLQLPSPSTVLEQALIKMRLAQVSVRIDSASFVFCTDTGGQPEYQELLSLLMAASNTVFIIFNLMHDLQSIQPLEYLPSVNEDPVQYESPHTVGEMLCQSLISVPIHNLPGEEMSGEKTQVRSDDKDTEKELVNRSCVFFVGTHKDKVSLQRIEEMNRSLIELIRHTPQYQANIVQRCSANSVIFAVDNFSSLQNDEDFVVIRRATQGLVYGSHLRVKAPTSWLFTGIVLQNLSETQPIISTDQYQEIARQCGIEHDSFRACLNFLHLRIGAIRYYDTEYLRNVVILKPQLIINILSQLMKRAFMKPFMKKSIIDDEDVSEVRKHFKIIDRNFLFELALDLLLTCPHPNSTVERPMYYLTCMLPLKNDITTGDESAAVLFTLEGFVLPTGLGRATITAIVQQQIASDVPLRISFDKLYRNSLEFTVSSPVLTFKIQSSEKHMCLTVLTTRIVKNETCADVRIKIESIMTEVLKLYHYGRASSPIVAFFCPNCGAGSSRPHYATLLSEDRIECSQTKKVSDIPPTLKHWVLVRKLRECSILYYNTHD